MPATLAILETVRVRFRDRPFSKNKIKVGPLGTRKRIVRRYCGEAPAAAGMR